MLSPATADVGFHRFDGRRFVGRRDGFVGSNGLVGRRIAGRGVGAAGGGVTKFGPHQFRCLHRRRLLLHRQRRDVALQLLNRSIALQLLNRQRRDVALPLSPIVRLKLSCRRDEDQGWLRHPDDRRVFAVLAASCCLGTKPLPGCHERTGRFDGYHTAWGISLDIRHL